MDTWPLAALSISLGIVKAETLSGPLVSKRSCLLTYLRNKERSRYQVVISRLGLRK